MRSCIPIISRVFFETLELFDQVLFHRDMKPLFGLYTHHGEMNFHGLISIRDASAQHKSTVQMIRSIVRRIITGTLYRAQQPPPSVISAVSALSAIPLPGCSPDERAAQGEKSVASCQCPR